MNLRKIGKFLIAAEILQEYPEDVRKILAECLIVRCEMIFYDRQLEYTAFNEAFDEILKGQLAPEYRCLLTLHTSKDGGGIEHRRITHEWERVK